MKTDARIVATVALIKFKTAATGSIPPWLGNVKIDGRNSDWELVAIVSSIFQTLIEATLCSEFPQMAWFFLTN